MKSILFITGISKIKDEKGSKYILWFSQTKQVIKDLYCPWNKSEIIELLLFDFLWKFQKRFDDCTSDSKLCLELSSS